MPFLEGRAAPSHPRCQRRDVGVYRSGAQTVDRSGPELIIEAWDGVRAEKVFSNVLRSASRYGAQCLACRTPEAAWPKHIETQNPRGSGS
jgi:hypothetical protein